MAVRAKQVVVDLGKRITTDRTRGDLKLRYVAGRSKLLPTAGRLPDFLVIGTMRGGTSSLYKYLDSHPGVRSSLRKEVHYFTRDYARGEAWYRAHFGLTGRRRNFEATPAYLAFKPAAARAAALVPEASLVVLLRDPVARAVSHYRHMVDIGREMTAFAKALELEPERVAQAVSDAERGIFNAEIGRHTYITRGLYGRQLEWWLEEFPPERIWVGSSEDFYADTRGALASIAAHVDIDPEGFSGTDRNYSRPPTGGARRDDEARHQLPAWALEALAEDQDLLRRVLTGRLRLKSLPSWLG
jgi:hypothetical protein